MFLTSVPYIPGGDFTGTIGSNSAQKRCTERATAGGLQGEFVPWLSIYGGVSALNLLSPADGPWCDCEDRLVALDQNDLKDKSLAQNIDRDETCSQHGKEDVWTGTNEDGVPSFQHCDGWTSGSADGLVGDSSMKNQTWTNAVVLPCTAPAHLYCFEK